MTTELVQLKWQYHASGSVEAEIPYGTIYISEKRKGWKVEINGTVLRAKPGSKEVAMQMATEIFTNTLLHWLYQHTDLLDN